MSEAPPATSLPRTSKLAPEPNPDDWAGDFLRLMDREEDASLGRRIVVVPDGNTLYALQRLCVSDQVARRCLTARYVISGPAALGTMLASFVSDVEAVRSRQPVTLGDLVDQEQGAHWLRFARRVAASSPWSGLVDERLPLARSAGRLTLSDPGDLFSAIGPPTGYASADASTPVLAPDECLVLLVDGDDVLQHVTDIVNVLPRGVLLVLTSPPERELDWLTELIGPVTRLPPFPGPRPSRDRITYEASALAADRPADVDALGMTGLASTTAKLLMHEGTGPICIGVEAPWGKGKSSFLRLVRGEAERQAASDPTGRRLLSVDFNAWVYNNAEQAWAGLAVEVIAAVESALTRRQRLVLRWSYAWHHRRAGLVGAGTGAALAIGLAVLVAVLSGWDVVTAQTDDPILLTLTAVSPAVVGLLVLVGAAYRLTRPVSQRVHEYLARPDHAVRRGYQNDVVSDLRFTLAALRRHKKELRVVVMVDDLDRCAEDKVVEILQAINVVLAQSDVYTLLAIDGDMVRRAVYRHYRDSAEADLPPEYQLDEDFPHEYLEKIVQFSIHLPPTSGATRAAYVRSLFTVPPAPEPATTAVASPHPSVGGRVKQGLEIDMSHVAPPTLGEFVDVPMADTLAEADAMALYHRLLDDNAREIKRAVNVHRFVKIALYRTESPPSEEIQRRLVLWVVLCLADPKAVGALLRRDDVATLDGDLLDALREPFAQRGIEAVPDRLPASDLPLFIAAANLIQLVGPDRA
ncbi:P-loop NTPase fold protein [Geodermatophilus sp. URMC 64]